MSLISSTSGAPLVEAATIETKGDITDGEFTQFIESPTIEEYVRKHFENHPVMAEVAKCESQFRHFNKNGDILRGEINTSDVGVMQINEYYHSDTAERLGIDLYTLEGNINYAKYLFEKEGTQPWSASSKCWSIENHITRK